ncbi:hypothetical protein Ddc_16945 [Ditylenchus destructor]|nr:hypothetical protein Ddc_16945 [Ditylenchus destructor]
MYAFLLDFEKTSGLYGDQGTFFMSTSQDDAFGNYHPMGSNSIYLKATSVSCDGCAVIENATCAPPGTVEPSTTAVSTVSTGLPTITPGDGGSCTECNSGLQMGTQYYWPSVLSPNPSPSQNIAAVSVQCQNMSNFCMCTESGECFQPFGQSLLAVNLYSFCDGVDPVQCHMYAFLIDFERTSGLYGDQGTFFMSTSQDDAFGNYHPMGSNSLYLKATSVSCDGCVVINNATCAPPGTAVPSTTAVSTVSTGFPTITPGCTQPINTSPLILDTADTDIHHGIPTKSCSTCSSGAAIGNKFYYSSVPSANSENDIESASAHCSNMNQFCMCTESGECFQQMGNTLNAVNFYSFCDGSLTPFPECHMYAFVIDAFDGSSGLIGDNGTVFISTSQIDANGNLLPMGPNSIYLKATAASCRGCAATRGIWTCETPTISGSPVTGEPVTILSDVTFETTEPLP